jgi:transposase InsO family protein
MKYIEKGFSAGYITTLLELPLSTFYYKSGNGPAGRPISRFTRCKDGGTVCNTVVVEAILELLRTDFVDYGYRKVTEWLAWRKAYLINHKKVLRLLRENKLMLPALKRSGASNRLRIKEKVPQPNAPQEHFEVDIKYIRVHGARRNALVISIIDTFNREWVCYHVGWNIDKEDFMKLVQELLLQLPAQPIFTIRSDNGSQFIAHDVAEFMSEKGIVHEFIAPATPEQNAHIESFHSVMQRAMVRTSEFESMEDLKQTLARFQHFYNNERLHSATCYRPPIVFTALWKAGFVTQVIGKFNKRKFILSKEEPLSSPFSEQLLFFSTQC